MIDETLDVIDEQGTVLHQEKWSIIHKKGLLHVTAACFIFKDEKREEVLLQQRSSTMDQDPGKYTFSAGGHILAGKTPEQGMREELHEELWYGVPMPDIPMHIVGTVPIHDLPGNYEHLFLYRLIHPGPFVIDLNEVQHVEWVAWKIFLEQAKATPEKFTKALLQGMDYYLHH